MSGRIRIRFPRERDRLTLREFGVRCRGDVASACEAEWRSVAQRAQECYDRPGDRYERLAEDVEAMLHYATDPSADAATAEDVARSWPDEPRLAHWA